MAVVITLSTSNISQVPATEKTMKMEIPTPGDTRTFNIFRHNKEDTNIDILPSLLKKKMSIMDEYP